MYWLKTFGGITLSGASGPVTGRAAQRHRLALLAVLAVAVDRGVSRERVIDLLWTDVDPDRGRRLLSDSIYRINRALGGEAVIASGGSLRLDPTRVGSDVALFAQAFRDGDHDAAVDAQPAPFLDGFFLSRAPEFDRWADTQRRRLARERTAALEELASLHERRDPVAAVRWFRALADADPYSSRLALRLMRCLEAAGDPAGAVGHADYHTRLVRDDLGLEPDPEVPRYASGLRGRPPAPTPSHSMAAGATDGATLRARQRPVGAPSPPHTAGSETEGPTRTARPRRATPPRMWAVGAATVVVLGATAAMALRSRSDAGPGATDPVEDASVVVLPFADLGAGGEDEILADGITEEIIARLSNVGGLRVVGRSSAFTFKGRTVDARTVGAQLHVGAVLDGSVRRAGDRIRITAQLVDARTGFELWSETHERGSEDVFATQDSVARAIVARFTGTDFGTVPSAAIDPEAYDLYLNGRFEWHRRTEAALRIAADHLERAVALAPEYARAHAGLGDAYAVLGFYDYLPPNEAFSLAERAALRAIDLDPFLAEPHATLGYVQLYHGWDATRAEASFQRAIDLAPGYSTAHQWYANLLAAQGRFPEALREMRIATELDPLSLIATTALGWVHYYAGDVEAALAQLARGIALDPEFELAYLWTGITYERAGRREEALTAYRRAVTFSGSAIARAGLARGLADAGRTGEARALLSALEAESASGYSPSYEIAKVHEALGEPQETLKWLQRAYEERSHSMVFLGVDPQLDRIRSRPAFQSLVQRVAFEGAR